MAGFVLLESLIISTAILALGLARTVLVPLPVLAKRKAR